MTTSLDSMLFVDLKTVASSKHFDQLEPFAQSLWTIKMSSHIKKYPHLKYHEIYKSKSGIYAEFGKIVCITIGYLVNEKTLKLTSFYGLNESSIISRFYHVLNDMPQANELKLVGHNIKEYIIPFIGRRSLVLSLELPKILRIQGKKPWEVKHLLDNLDFWKFGDHKHYNSQNLLAFALDIQNKRIKSEDLDLHSLYYEKEDLQKIKELSAQDLLLTSQVFLKLNGSAFGNDLKLVEVEYAM